MAWRQIGCWIFIGLLVLTTGCTPPKKKRSSAPVTEEVKESFERLKEAIAELREGHTDKFWNLLSDASQAEANKRAKAFRADYAKRESHEQEEIAEKLGVRADELRERLNGFGYVRVMSETIYERYWMIPGAAVDHPNVEGDDAVRIFYTADESDREKSSVLFVLEDGQWLADLRIP
jgi:hypothetical protein